jgi:hypothetical protein
MTCSVKSAAGAAAATQSTAALLATPVNLVPSSQRAEVPAGGFEILRDKTKSEIVNLFFIYGIKTYLAQAAVQSLQSWARLSPFGICTKVICQSMCPCRRV